MVVKHCRKRDSKDTIKNTKEGRKFNSKKKIPWTVRLWLRRKNLASKALSKVRTVKGCKRLKENIKETEAALDRESLKKN